MTGVQIVGIRDLNEWDVDNDFALDEIELIDKSAGGVIGDLDKGSLKRGTKGDILEAIEDIKGTTNDDFLIGDDDSNLLYGDHGNDTLHGGYGRDVLSGGGGDDIFDGGSDEDILLQVDRDGYDILDGGDGEDLLDLRSIGALELSEGFRIDFEKNRFGYRNTEYQLVDGITREGEVTITNEARWEVKGKDSGDRFLFVNGSKMDNKMAFFKKEIELRTGHEYRLSFQIAINKNVQIALNIDGIDVGVVAPESYEEWVEYTIDFTALRDGEQRVSLRSLLTDESYNDFMIDDIELKDMSLEGVEVNLKEGFLSKGSGSKDIVKNIEGVVGSEYDDILIGDDVNNALVGLGGNDYIEGGKGDDVLNGGYGINILDGGEGEDEYILSLEGLNIIVDGDFSNSLKVEVEEDSVYFDSYYQIGIFRYYDDLIIEFSLYGEGIGLTIVDNYFSQDGTNIDSISIENKFLQITNLENIVQDSKTDYTQRIALDYSLKGYYKAPNGGSELDFTHYNIPKGSDDKYENHIFAGDGDDIFTTSDWVDVFHYAGSTGEDHIYNYSIDGDYEDRIELPKILGDVNEDDLSKYIEVIGVEQEGGDVTIKFNEDSLSSEQPSSYLVLHDVGGLERNQDPTDLIGILDHLNILYGTS